MVAGLQECNAKVASKGRYLSIHLQTEPPTFDSAGFRSTTLNQQTGERLPGAEAGRAWRLHSRKMGCSAASYSSLWAAFCIRCTLLRPNSVNGDGNGAIAIARTITR